MNVRLSIVTDTSIGRDLTLKKDKENPVRSFINMIQTRVCKYAVTIYFD